MVEQIAYKKENPENKNESMMCYDASKFEQIMNDISKEAQLYGDKTKVDRVGNAIRNFGDQIASRCEELGKVDPKKAQELIERVNNDFGRIFLEYDLSNTQADNHLNNLLNNVAPSLAQQIKDSGKSWQEKASDWLHNKIL